MTRVKLDAILAEHRRLIEAAGKHGTKMNRLIMRHMAGEPLSLVCICDSVAPLDADICPKCHASLDDATAVSDRFLRIQGLL